MGVTDHIQTYGDLLNEIKRVEKQLKDIQNRTGYEAYEDDVDFILYLNHLKELKRYNDARFEFMQEVGLYECEKCKSHRLDYEEQRNVRIRGYDYCVTCRDCGHQAFREVTDEQLKYALGDFYANGLI